MFPVFLWKQRSILCCSRCKGLKLHKYSYYYIFIILALIFISLPSLLWKCPHEIYCDMTLNDKKIRKLYNLLLNSLNFPLYHSKMEIFEWSWKPCLHFIHQWLVSNYVKSNNRFCQSHKYYIVKGNSYKSKENWHYSKFKALNYHRVSTTFKYL